MRNFEQLESQLSAKAKADGIAIFSVGAAIFKGSKLLVMKRKMDDTFPGMYEIPGGGVEKGETIAEALKREIREETGLAIKSIDRYVLSFDYDLGEKAARDLAFIVSVEKGKIILTEHDSFAWITRKELRNYRMTREMRTQVEQAFELHSR